MPALQAPAAATTRSVALIGNPNTGKSTLFNGITGFRARVANYPGVTVDKKHGPFRGLEGVEALDLPGTYSLAARSPDEMVAVDVLLGRRDDTPRPAAAVVVVDASNLERNLYLATQVLETGLPVVVALNMMDAARARGHEIDVAALSRRLGVPVVPCVASRGEGLAELSAAVAVALEAGRAAEPVVAFPEALRATEVELARVLAADRRVGRLPPFEVRRVLLDVSGHAERRVVARVPEAAAAIATARAALERAGCSVAGLEARLRYEAIGALLAGVSRLPADPPPTATDRIDAILTHRLLGTLVFAGVMTLTFLAIFSWAGPLMDALDQGVFGALKDAVVAWGGLGGGALESLVVDGVIGGVGGVLVFLPQILILFGFLAILEDCGYMARAAFLMDRLLRWCGLSGRSFIPMLSSFACAVPGILATRTIENRRDRLATILVAPLMSCSARIPVYVILIGAFVPATRVVGPIHLQALVFAGLYFVGIAVAIPVAWILKRTLLRGETPPFLMELPPYKVPGPRAVVSRMLGQGKAFLVRAGTLILATSVVVWALSYFPHDPSVAQARDRHVARAEAAAAADLAAATSDAERDASRARLGEERTAADRESLGRWRRESFLGRFGRAIEPAVAPIGWDWKVAVAIVASFPAREVVVGSLGVIYDLGEVDEEGHEALREKIRGATWDDGPRKGTPVFDLASALALAVFFALCMQCASTLAVTWRETGSWRWPAFSFAYMTTLAYLGAWATALVVRGLS